jgi:AhpC/TSA antioxidant enzyme
MSDNSVSLEPAILDAAKTQTGESLLALSRQMRTLVVFLRHPGWTFCRQALAELAEKRSAIAAQGTGLVLVHMQTDTAASALFARYGLQDVPRISDPGRQLYEAFELSRGSLAQVAGPRVWLRGLLSLFKGHVPGVPEGDVLQMPGVFLLNNGRIERAYRHATSADRPDYCELAGPQDLDQRE